MATFTIVLLLVTIILSISDDNDNNNFIIVNILSIVCMVAHHGWVVCHVYIGEMVRDAWLEDFFDDCRMVIEKLRQQLTFIGRKILQSAAVIN